MVSMKKFFQKFQLFYWFGKRLVGKYWQIFISSFIAGLLLVLLSIRLYPALTALAFKKEKIIGVVGSYTPSNLPLPIQNLLSTGLVGVTLSGEPVPALASNWETTDNGKRYVFHLKNNIVWHDGKQLKARDINYNLRDVEIHALDDQTLEVNLKDSFTPLPILLSKPLFRKGLVGVGSYRLSGIRFKGNTITFLRLVPSSTTSDLLPLTIKFYPSEEAAKLGFILGEVNTLDEVVNPDPFLNWQQVSVKQNVKHDRYVGLFFNMDDKLLSEKSIRQALAFCLEKPEKNTVLTPLSSQSWAYNNNVKQYNVDLSASKKYLDKVIQATESAEITLSTFNEYLDLAHEIAQQWEKLDQISIKIKVESRIPDDFQILLGSQEIPPDPDQYPFWHSTQKGTNITHYNNPKIDKLLEDGRRESITNKRKAIYYEFQKNLVEDVPVIFLFHPTIYTISRN